MVFSDELNSPGTFRVTPSGVSAMLGGNKALPSEILEARYVFIIQKLSKADAVVFLGTGNAITVGRRKCRSVGDVCGWRQ